LKSISDHPPPVPWEAVVVDNGSSDGSVAAVRASAPWASIIDNQVNRGLAAANNQGLRAALGDAIVICNPDVTFESGALAAMLAVLERHEKAAFVVPRLLHPDGSLATSAGDLPTLGEALRGRQAQRRRRRPASGFWWDGWAHDEERRIGRGAEAAYLVRRRAIDDFGLQDERFVLDWEGPDWTARADDAGWEVWFCPQATVVHRGGTSIRQVPVRWIVSSHRGMYRYFAKRRPGWQRPALAALCTGRAVLKLAASAVGRANYDRGHRGVRR
jgi:GT2 family glycosyltransferase